MMAVAWPGTLPQKVNEDGFQLKKGGTVIRSDMDIGPAKLRRRFTKGVDNYVVTMDMTYAQYAIFDSYFDLDLNGGVNTFSFLNPVTQVSEIWRMTEPDMRPKGGEWVTVNMVWERMPA